MDDKKVLITLTEEITGTDRQAEVEAKRAGLIAALLRHGVDIADQKITETWIGDRRVLLGEGLGMPIEMTEEMEKRRKEENDALVQKAMLQIAANSMPAAALDPTAAVAATAQLAEAQRLNEETKALVAKLSASGDAGGTDNAALVEAQRLNADTKAMCDQMTADRKSIEEKLLTLTAGTVNLNPVPLDAAGSDESGPAATKVEKKSK